MAEVNAGQNNPCTFLGRFYTPFSPRTMPVAFANGLGDTSAVTPYRWLELFIRIEVVLDVALLRRNAFREDAVMERGSDPRISSDQCHILTRVAQRSENRRSMVQDPWRDTVGLATKCYTTNLDGNRQRWEIR